MGRQIVCLSLAALVPRPRLTRGGRCLTQGASAVKNSCAVPVKLRGCRSTQGVLKVGGRRGALFHWVGPEIALRPPAMPARLARGCRRYERPGLP